MAQDLPNYFKTYRKLHGMTQKEISHLLGYERGETVSRLERRRKEPTLRTVLAYKVLFNTSIEKLIPVLCQDIEEEVQIRLKQFVSSDGIKNSTKILLSGIGCIKDVSSSEDNPKSDMKPNEDSTTRVLSVYPTVRGFGFSVFEGSQNPIDWGSNTVSYNKNKARLGKMERLIDFYSPEVVVTENCNGPGSRRNERTVAFLSDNEDLCDKKNQKIVKYSKRDLSDYFYQYGASTQHEIATKISVWLPSLAPYLPSPRKPWMSEDYRMAAFDAIALALTYYQRGE